MRELEDIAVMEGLSGKKASLLFGAGVALLGGSEASAGSSGAAHESESTRVERIQQVIQLSVDLADVIQDYPVGGEILAAVALIPTVAGARDLVGRERSELSAFELNPNGNWLWVENEAMVLEQATGTLYQYDTSGELSAIDSLEAGYFGTWFNENVIIGGGSGGAYLRRW
jgi:hypothetical protein